MPLPPTSAAWKAVGGWIAPDGRFYVAEHGQHISVAAQLRAMGDGPREPWDMRDGWVMVRTCGEALSAAELTQAQLDTLGDMAFTASPLGYHRNVMASFHRLVDLTQRIARKGSAG